MLRTDVEVNCGSQLFAFVQLQRLNKVPVCYSEGHVHWSHEELHGIQFCDPLNGGAAYRPFRQADCPEARRLYSFIPSFILSGDMRRVL